MNTLRPWHSKTIDDCGECLLALPNNFLKILPHPYLSLGAPYKSKNSPWFLREDVLRRLQLSQKYLGEIYPSYSLIIFDAWRPVLVQEFMIEYEVRRICNQRNIDCLSNKSEALRKIKSEVSRFWAAPSKDPMKPPPHSTGAAIDLTFIDSNGIRVNMGGQIDEIGSCSRPDFYSHKSKLQPIEKEFAFRRNLLKKVMQYSGFVQHPMEWWHYSYGDQMWAWTMKTSKAIYGSVEPSSCKTDSSPI